jgi:glutamine amidotransferase
VLSGTIVIVDYQMGNLRSVEKALQRVGAQTELTSDPARVAAADKLVLPGVGAFPDAVSELRQRGLIPAIESVIAERRPFLGICLGLQLLFDEGTEGGRITPGLGILPGRVERLERVPPGGKIPHMGWNQVHPTAADCPLMDGIEAGSHFYFVHSYVVRPSRSQDVWLECEYGEAFCAAVWRDRLFATQFHPEKSQRVGLQLLENFVGLD